MQRGETIALIPKDMRSHYATVAEYPFVNLQISLDCERQRNMVRLDINWRPLRPFLHYDKWFYDRCVVYDKTSTVHLS